MHPRKRLLTVFVAALLIPATSALAIDDSQSPEPRIISLGTDPRIIGGNDADPGEYPHQVGLIAAGFEGNIWGGQFCGGALIDALWVMTAAHCIEAVTDVITPDPTSLFIYADSYDLAGSGTSITVAQIFVHEQWNSSTVENDIALIQLNSPASSEPIRYATPDEAALFAAGTNAIVTGWGDTDPTNQNNYPSILQEAVVPVVSDAGCTVAYGVWYVNPEMLCAGYDEGGIDSCFGDSGGPLAVDAGDGSLLHIGIVSWGVACAQAGFPGVYARTSTYASWIFDKTGIAGGVAPDPGLLRVVTDPAVASQILVDGVPYDTWGLSWVKLPPGTYQVSFSDVEGFSTPAAQSITVTEGATTAVTGSFTQRGFLRVITDPAVPATISVDGVPRNDWGMWTDLEAGDYQVCFGDVADYTTPACETATVTAGATTIITGTYISNPGAAEPTGYGWLRVVTSPAVASQILVDGVARDTWGLNWLKVPAGDYTVSFRDLEGFSTPAAQTVTVTEGTTTAVTGTFTPRGWIRAITSPALVATITVDGIPRNDWGMWTDFDPGDYQVCFGDVAGYTTPVCQTATVTAGTTSTITGTYN
ncbi:MAG: serine protease [Acidobacteria bacterium]|nr:serine protease [Acidobacteriota bacterium]